jgi:indole-3-glycerol phosphate synthase
VHLLARSAQSSKKGGTSEVPTKLRAVISRSATYLDRIVEAHRQAAAQDQRNLSELSDQASAVLGSSRGFRAALKEPGLSVIAEIKRRSPSKGALNVDLDAAALAATYEGGGAGCLSVLTDVDHFGGSIADLQSARAATTIPVLRKDFTVSLADIYDARIMGADCILLIAAALSDDELLSFHTCAVGLQLDVLVEIHDEMELQRALKVGATLVGVNQRDLHTFAVDHDRARRVGRAMPDTVVRVAESGVRGPDDAASLAEAGFDAVLVGESVVTSHDPGKAVRALRNATQAKGVPNVSC